MKKQFKRWVNIKFKLGGNVYKKDTDFEVKYWGILDKLCNSFKQYRWQFYEKKINTWILNKGKRTGY